MIRGAEGWYAQQGGGALKRGAIEIPDAGRGEVVVKVEACGLCHTDFGYARAQVAPKHPLPLVLGHEIVGTVVEAGEGATGLMNAKVLVPAVLPCGDCAFCKAGRGNACQAQKMPGNDIHGGFSTHCLVPAAPLVRIDGFEGAKLRALGVVADAVSTAYQAALRANLKKGELAVIIGSGGVGAFLVQIAKSMGAHVMAVDVKEDRLKLAEAHGAERTFKVAGDVTKELKKAVGEMGKSLKVPTLNQKIFECSGTAAGQNMAYALIPHGGTVVFVGFTMDKVQVRLSNLMALDATAVGSWGCPPDAYPEVLRLVKEGQVKLEPFIEEAPMSRINEFMDAMEAHTLERRMVLIPDFN
jgi:6-hydroxycyclohex-1-ene-1-carbonyl-CoA dehydrogenase